MMFSVDVGGTFTDVVAVSGSDIRTVKVSTDYSAIYDAVVGGAKELGLENGTIFNHASTHGLNAVITRKLPKIGVLATVGHRDTLDHGSVFRPMKALLDPNWRREFGDARRPLVERYLRRTIHERIKADGSVLFRLDEDQARAEINVLAKCNVEGVAITLMNSYVNDTHELRLRELVREILGDIPVSISSEVSPVAHEYARASTTTIDACMKILFSDYIEKLESGLSNAGFNGALNFADCAATLVPADRALIQPFRIVFAGPAAGTVASADFGRMIGEQDLLCSDVGGTSCDISLVTNGAPYLSTTFELEHDLVVSALANDVTSVGAGGGSIVQIGSSGELQVGPDSAGSTPGPACYGKGGTQPTTTDTCLLAGIIEPAWFADGRIALDIDKSREAFEALDTDFTYQERVRYAYELGLHNLAEAMTNVAIKNGIDPREYSLMAYGAAGPMLLPATLDLVHAKSVIVPPHPGLFSALGLLAAEQVYTSNRGAYTFLVPENAAKIDAIYADMEQALLESLDTDREVTIVRSLDARLAGQEFDMPFIEVPDGLVDADAIAAIIRNFHDTYFARTGSRFEAFPVEGVTYRIQATVASEKVEYPQLPARGAQPLSPVRSTTIQLITDTPFQVPVYNRLDLCAGDRIEGPAIVSEKLSTTHITAGQRVDVGLHGELVITSGASRGEQK
ncbi:hydantoinase/oxoprolinase family protein [Arthrobacter sp. 2MCAF14]|uniref:hydantoinase/oxoprolinase family protein n=1 Tax=Arthrobacter sp. 2MCAF14 TaxID=3232982 RepID=UPI003F925CD6